MSIERLKKFAFEHKRIYDLLNAMRNSKYKILGGGTHIKIADVLELRKM